MNKCLVFIVSGGRTGTTFLGSLLSYMITNSFSVHEPDLFEGFTKNTLNRIKIFGFYHMVLGRILGRTGIRNLSQQYQKGKLSHEFLSESLQRQRNWYYSTIDAGLIIESYYQWYGILPVVPRVFPYYKVLGIIRDPRDWVSSWLNYEAHFGKRDIVTRLGFSRLNPKMVGDDHYIQQWNTMSSFQKLCWTWSQVYDRILSFTRDDPCSVLIRYEDLFLIDEREHHFLEMLNFITDFGDKQFHYDFRSELLRRKVNATDRKLFPDWKKWNHEEARQLDEICGPQMADYDYGKEPEWLDKLSS